MELYVLRKGHVSTVPLFLLSTCATFISWEILLIGKNILHLQCKA